MLPAVTVVSFLLAVTSVCLHQPQSTKRPPPLETSSIESFWRLFDVLQAGDEPTSGQWQAVLESDGYRSYSGRMQQLFREVWPVTFAASRQAEREALRVAQPALRPYLEHFSAVAARAQELRRFQASLATTDFQEQARSLAMNYLPAAAHSDPEWPRIIPVVAEPDGKAVGEMIVIDLLLSADLGPFLTHFVAHEMHHVYGRRLRVYHLPEGDKPEGMLLHAIDQLALEGIADLIDKPTLLATTSPFAESYRAALRQSEASVETVASLLEGIAEDRARMRGNAAAIWKALPFAGHTTGFYMAQTIRDGLGTAALNDCIVNPFAFFAVYNRAALALTAAGRARPVFSVRALSVIADLERAAPRRTK